MHLLISLGTSWPIVPEAYLHPGHSFSEVHVLTTSSPKVETGLVPLREWFTSRAPEIRLTVTRAGQVPDITRGDDHEAFEEVLFRWFAERQAAARTAGAGVQVCLAGGFKTISAGMQQAAEVFGCQGLFHVLANGNPLDADAIDTALRNGEIHWIELGSRAGWPEFRGLEDAARSLAPPDGAGDRTVNRFAPPERTLRRRVTESLQRFQRIAARWDRLEELPFRSLATLTEAELAWLSQPLDPDAEPDRAWVASLPKVELHCHLGGFATGGDELLEVRSAALWPDRLPPVRKIELPPGWPLPPRPCGLEVYMRLGDNNGSAILRDPGCLRRQITLLYGFLRKENIAYAEIRCSPGNYADPDLGRTAWDVLMEIMRTFDECRDRLPADQRRPRVNLLVIATRREGGDFRTGISRHLALAATAAEQGRDRDGCRVVGVDLAGYEDRATRAHYFREDFTAVHRAGLAVTVHAGENDDAEAIWSAVFDLNARRIGHALHLIHSPALLEVVAARGIGIEMCPYANQQIVGFALPKTPGQAAPARDRYPLSDYLRRGIPVSVNTDNIGISGAGGTENALLAARLCPGLTRLELVAILANAINTSFLSALERQSLLADCGAMVAKTIGRLGPGPGPGIGGPPEA